MAFWPFNRSKAYTDSDIAASVPLVTDISTVLYPEDNYSNFAKEGYGRSELVHACIRELASGVASARFFVGVEEESGVVEVENSPAAYLLNHPNPNQDFPFFIENLITHLQVSGNAYILKERARSNEVSAIWLLRPDRVAVQPEDRGINHYTYTIDGKEYVLPPEDVAHLALPNPSGDVYGLSPLHVLSRTINLDMSMTDFAKVFFQNAGVPSGLLKVKRRLTSQEEASRIRARWRSTFGGVNNAHSVAILDEDAEYQQMSSAPKDMALTDLRNITESRICSVFGVPPILIGANVGLQRSTFSNYREARFSFHSETLEPLINRIARFLEYCLVDNPAEKIMIDLSDMRGFLDDKDSIASRTTQLFGSGIITLNEARALVGQDAVDGGEVRRVPSTVVETSFTGDSPLSIEEGRPTQSLKAAPLVASGAVRLKRSLLESRERLTDNAEVRIRKYLKRVQNRADGVLGRHMERNTEESKQFDFGWTDLVPAAEEGELSNSLLRIYTDVVRDTFDNVNESNIAGFLAFNEKLPAVQRILTTAGTRAKMIHSTTSKVVQNSVETALRRGYSIEQLARGVPAENFPGIRATLSETQVRARLIARTEVMRSQNLSSLAHFNTQGFEYMRADDVDGDEGDTYVDPGDPYGRTCIERNGQVYHVEDARNINDHPNGTLNWSPMPRAYQPEGVTV